MKGLAMSASIAAMKALVHFIGRLFKRISHWGNRPLSEEQLRWIRRISDAAGYKRGYNDALEKPITQVAQPKPPEVLNLPTGEWARRYTETHPSLVQKSPKQTVRLVPPIDHITTQKDLAKDITPDKITDPEVRKALHDDSWLNSRKEEKPHEPFLTVDDGYAVTEQRPAMPKNLKARFYPRV
jgi:hypothetical protein